ncbi:MAG TPA: DNA mismatch repair endonuclease MutL [Verrucomicrobiae bacterium]|nr:DNA mismatch repair endonuclease MutL [Verrucomicrobiae bacterium]
MNRIHLLPDHVANQIAAGEVVERPASVVKELVENALDAQAVRITVEIQAGGRSLIRITDDGVGMSRDDALLSLERHATSKIRSADDLSAIATMGFRGEALPSIASVSRFTLTTRERDNASPEGTQIVVNGGKITEVKAAGCAPGTTIEVRQLFFNVPARRKFLRTEETESAHIQHYVTLAALAHPAIAFTFIKDTRVVWQLPAVKSGSDAAARLDALRERLRAVLGGEERLLAVDATGELNWSEGAPDEAGPETAGQTRKSPMRVWGFIGAPGVSRSTREDQHVFVNRRPVENRELNYALMEGYHTALMKGRFPLCCLFVEIDPALVDVNIHPAKREVKFHREFEVRRVVMNAVRQTLLNFHTATVPAGGAVSGPAKSAALSASPPVPAAIEPSLPKFELSPAPAPAPVPQHREQPALPMGFAPPARPVPAPVQMPAATPVAPVAAPLGTGAVPLLQVPLRMVGVIGRLYVVLESDRGLVLLDQHAAHERILYEQMLTRVEQGGQAPLQRLLLPETLELSVRDATFLRQQMETLTRLGVSLSEFGERTFLLDALPPFVKVSDARRFALELVDELKAAGEDVNSARLGEQVVAKTVCRHAVKANDPLAGRELENLVEDLRRCAMPYTCPHGRPTLIEMSWRELEKKFGRTQ